MVSGSKLLGPLEVIWESEGPDKIIVAITLASHGMVFHEEQITPLDSRSTVDVDANGLSIKGRFYLELGDSQDSLWAELTWGGTRGDGRFKGRLATLEG